MTEIEQLRADLATIQEAASISKKQGYHDRTGNYDKVEIELKEKIAELEAQQQKVDPWRLAKYALYQWDVNDIKLDEIAKQSIFAYVQNLEAKVAELDHELRCEQVDGGKVRADLRAEIAARDSVAYLGDFRVLKTAQDIAEYSEKSANSPHNLIFCRDLVAAINNFTLYVRLREGLSSLDPYKWSSVGLYDEHLIDKKDGGKVRDDRRAILVEQNRQELAELTTILNAIPAACGLARELVERRIESVKREMQGNG